MSSILIAGCHSDKLRTQLQNYFASVNYAVEFIDGIEFPTSNIANFLLSVEHVPKLYCRALGEKVALSIQYHGGANDHRRKYGGGKSQLLGKATGIAAGYKPKILDATAGLGGDAFTMACLGADVVMCERNPLLYWLLQSAIQAAISYAYTGEPHETLESELLDIEQMKDQQPFDQALVSILQRLSLYDHSPRSALNILGDECGQLSPEVIYLDPMFPERKKSAMVKKDMQILHHLLQDDELEESPLLEAALDNASHRVVVKRPAKAPFLAGRQPSYELKGKSVRYDIYAKRKLS